MHRRIVPVARIVNAEVAIGRGNRKFRYNLLRAAVEDQVCLSSFFNSSKETLEVMSNVRGVTATWRLTMTV